MFGDHLHARLAGDSRLSLPHHQLEQLVESQRYRSIELMGHTDQLAFYRAIDCEDNKEVVLKLLMWEKPGSAALSRLKHQYKLIGADHIPGLVKMRSLEYNGANHILCMEDAGPYTLNDLIRSGPVDVDQFLSLAIKIVQATVQMHGHFLLHRDLNPGNIVLNADLTEPTIVGFGSAINLSRAGQYQAVLVRPLNPDGNLLYISPERTGRMNRTVDYRSDLYSLGVIFY